MEFDPAPTTAPNTVLPALANGVSVAGGAGAWALAAAPVEVAAAGTVPAGAFVIDRVHIDTPSGAMLAELRLYYGAADTACGVVAFEIATDAGGYLAIPVFSGVITGGSRIRANLATAAGGAQTVLVKVAVRAL